MQNTSGAGSCNIVSGSSNPEIIRFRRLPFDPTRDELNNPQLRNDSPRSYNNLSGTSHTPTNRFVQSQTNTQHLFPQRSQYNANMATGGILPNNFATFPAILPPLTGGYNTYATVTDFRLG